MIFGLTKFLDNQSCIRLIFNSNFNYVKMKDIQSIKENCKQEGIFKVFSKSCSFYMKQAWNDFKTDFQIFKSIKAIQQKDRNQKQKVLYRKIKADILKFGPAFLVFNVPFGFPLFYLYLRLFPQLIPSWMMVDSIHQKIVEGKQKKRIDAWNYYVKKFDCDLRMAYLKQAIYKSNQSLEDIRRISLICYGDYIDGTEYISSNTNLQLKNGLFTPRFSLFLLRKFLQNQLSHDYYLQNELKSFQTFQDKLNYKLQKEIQNYSQ